MINISRAIKYSTDLLHLVYFFFNHVFHHGFLRFVTSGTSCMRVSAPACDLEHVFENSIFWQNIFLNSYHKH